MTRSGRSDARGTRARTQAPRRRSTRQAQELIPVLADVARDIQTKVSRGPARATERVKFQAVAQLVREERERVNASTELNDAKRAQQLKRLDGVATMLATIAARDTALLALLADDARVSDSTRRFKADLMRAGGMEPPAEPEPEPTPEIVPAGPATPPKGVVPQSVVARQLANPFLAPDFEATAARHASVEGRLSHWELLDPLFRAFETGGAGTPACMELPPARPTLAPGGRVLMPHQAQLVAAAARGHRTFLLADEPGLGKTAQSLLAAQAADAYPLLVVAPNVVKANWAREVDMWTPGRRATVVHGDGDKVDAFADVVIVNYAVLDRHVGWFADHGFKGMVLDEAHFIKNKGSQRSQHVLALADKIRARTARPLLMALTGTPLVNDVEDFRAIWQFLGWIDDEKPRAPLMRALEDTGLQPLDAGFSSRARSAVIDMGIVRRRKVDVAADIPARRVADLAVELEGAEGRSIRAAEQAVATRLADQYRSAVAARGDDAGAPFDRALARRIAAAELKDSSSKKTGDNVFTMVRRIGQAKAALAADFTAQLAHNLGKVVFFAKHIDVMDEAQRIFDERGLRHVAVRGDQSAKAREESIRAFTEDPDVSVIVCSLMAAGVGLNLQVASNLVLAELSWTDAEQTQAIDRVHRIGQSEPVTAWRILATQTVDTTIAALVDAKSGLAARALDGAEDGDGEEVDVQVEALVALLEGALAA